LLQKFHNIFLGPFLNPSRRRRQTRLCLTTRQFDKLYGEENPQPQLCVDTAFQLEAMPAISAILLPPSPCLNAETSGLGTRRCSRKPVGFWAACRKWSALVDRGKWPRLAKRAVREFAARHSVDKSEMDLVAAQLNEVIRLFSQHRRCRS